MDMFDEIEDTLGIESVDPAYTLALDLVAADRDFLEALIALRLKKGITQTQVAERLGRNKSSVSNFEQLGSDPHLSTVRRYAAAVGVRYSHVAEDVDNPSHRYDSVSGWTVSLSIGPEPRTMTFETFRNVHFQRNTGEFPISKDFTFGTFKSVINETEQTLKATS
ncbi:MAG: helix-turn-helix transcriptional regulator [Rhodococcus sp. (in: high G+C Gram-positive bacteria)]